MFTKNQKLAMEIEGGNVLVSAGAGSGKTTVLTKRIIEKLKKGNSIDNFLVLTFTNAAASEMKTRIKKAIKDEGNMEEELAKLDIADVTTFDAFLLKLVKKYSYILNMNSKINIGDSLSLNKLLDEVIDSVFLDIYKEIDRDKTSGYFELFNNYFVFNDDNLKINIKSLYYIYSNILNKDEQRNKISNEFIEESFLDYENYLNSLCRDIIKEVNILKAIYTDDKTQEKIEEKMLSYEAFDSINTYDGLKSLLENFQKEKVTGFNKSENSIEIKRVFKNLNNKVDYLISKTILKDKEEILEEEKNKYEIKDKLFDILEEIKKRYLNEKIKTQVFDYADIMDLALILLQNEDVLKEVKDQYVEILVDEYQDTNDFQNYFISLLENDNLYLVGDVKQSIYGFRNANPKNFNFLLEKYNKNKDDNVINLLDNFRSREEVLDSVNNVFSKLMTKDIGDINYSDKHALSYGNKSYELKDEKLSYQTEFYSYLSDDLKEAYDIHSKEIEPYIIANDIINKLKNKYQVGNGKLRNATYSDFVILTRNKTDYMHYNKVFEEFKIPIDIQMEDYLNDKYNYDILTLLSLLKLVSNPNDNLSKISILRSFLYLSEEQKIYDYVIKGIKSKELLDIEEKIDYIRSLNIGNLELLLDVIYNEFNFYEKVVKLDNIVGLVKRIDKINSIAASYTLEGKNLDDFVKYIEYSLEEEDNKLEVESNTDSLDSVKLMTIHKSKGLEFNIVYLPNLNTKILRSKKDLIDFNNNYGFIMPKIKNYVKEDGFLKHLNYLNEFNKELNESIRLLYVAMTRAKEKVIFLSDEKRRASSDADLLYFESLKTLEDLIFSSINPEFKYISELEFNYEAPNKQIDIIGQKFNYKEVKLKKNIVRKNKFSKDVTSILKKDQKNSINLGIYMHEFLEKIDLKKLIDKEYLKEVLDVTDNELLKEVIIKISKEDILNEIINYWTEYEFYYEDEKASLHGVIDLLIETKDNVYIIDYKLSNIDSEEYNKQVLNYKKYISSYFKKDIKCYLYSLLKNDIKEVVDEV